MYSVYLVPARPFAWRTTRDHRYPLRWRFPSFHTFLPRFSVSFHFHLSALFQQRNGRKDSNPGARRDWLHVTPLSLEPSQVRLLTFFSGGSIVTELLKSKDQSYILSALVRKPEQIEELKGIGVEGIIFSSLDDDDAIRDAAKEHDS